MFLNYQDKKATHPPRLRIASLYYATATKSKTTTQYNTNKLIIILYCLRHGLYGFTQGYLPFALLRGKPTGNTTHVACCVALPPQSQGFGQIIISRRRALRALAPPPSVCSLGQRQSLSSVALTPRRQGTLRLNP